MIVLLVPVVLVAATSLGLLEREALHVE